MQKTRPGRFNSVDVLHGDGGILVAFSAFVFPTQCFMQYFHTCHYEMRANCVIGYLCILFVHCLKFLALVGGNLCQAPFVVALGWGQQLIACRCVPAKAGA